VPPLPPPSPAAQLLAAAKETSNVARFDLLIERFPVRPEAREATPITARPWRRCLRINGEDFCP
jgi:hypothetical protein